MNSWAQEFSNSNPIAEQWVQEFNQQGSFLFFSISNPKYNNHNQFQLK